MSKKKKGNGISPLSGQQKSPLASPLLGGMFSKAGVGPAVVPEASVETLLPRLNEEMPQEERAKLEQEVRELLSEEATELALEREQLKAERATLEQKVDALHSEQEAFDKKSQELKILGEVLAKKEAALLGRERELEVRELNARNDFLKQNEEALSELKAEIENLEQRRLAIVLEMESEQSEARARHRQEIEERVSAIKAREAELDAGQLALDGKVAELEAMQHKLSLQQRSRDEVLRVLRQQVEIEFADDIRRRDEEIHRFKTRLDRLNDALSAERERYDEFAQLSLVLEGRDPATLLDELDSLRHENRELQRRLRELETAESIGELDRLQEERDAALAQVRDLRQELEQRLVSAHQQKMVVLEREQWAKEKLLLERTKVLLDGQIRDLTSRISSLVESQQAEVAFPELARMDKDPYQTPRPVDSVGDLKIFTEELRHRIATAFPGNPLYFRLEDLQLFVGGLAMSQLHVFQGISGTGKTSLAKAFAKVVGGECQDIAVQAGWRDRSDLLGHYNAFEKRFAEKECLQAMYRALTPSASDRLNVVLLDEMNLSRPEQYFADFLSALEKTADDRWIRLMESAPPNAPRLLRDGREIRLPQNLWFIGTANQDETTNELADKTHDRAFVLELPRHEGKFVPNTALPARTYSFESLLQAFKEAQKAYRDAVVEMLGFVSKSELSSVLEKDFGIGWGNRFERQAMSFMPVVKACGGTLAGALDHLLSSRIFRNGKVVGRYDVSKDQLDKVEQALELVFQKIAPKEPPLRCAEAIERDRKRLERGV